MKERKEHIGIEKEKLARWGTPHCKETTAPSPTADSVMLGYLWGMARNLIVRPDVRRRLGSDGVRMLRESPLVNNVECFVCGKEETLDSGAQMTVSIVVAYEGDKESVRTRFAHPGCASSSVLPGHPEHESDLASELIWVAMVRGPRRMPILVYGPDSILMGREASDGPLVEAWTDYFRRLGFVFLKEGDAVPIVRGVKVEIGRSEIAIHYTGSPKPDQLPIRSDLESWFAAIRATNSLLLVTGAALDLDHLTDESFDRLLAEGRAVAGAVKVEFRS